MATSVGDDGFTSVTHKKPVRLPRNRKGKNRFVERSLEDKLIAREEGLTRTGYLEKCREMVRAALSPRARDEEDTANPPDPCPPPTCVVCLGLGSISESSKSQDQYVLLQALLQELKDVLDDNVQSEFYDPVFSPEDVAFLSSRGHKVLSADHSLRLSRSTLLYIPHGPRTLFEALLRANWSSAAQLQHVILLANRLDLYDDPTYSGSLGSKGARDARGDGEASVGGDELGESAEFIVRASKVFQIVPLPATKDHLEAFNDLALEWAVPARLEGKADTFWLKPAGAEESDEQEEPGLQADPVAEAASAVQGLALGA
ncbi:hypothetical protein JCM3770_006134 [Rhodotorula araucariae]